MRILAILLTGILYFHLIGQEVPVVNGLPGNLVAIAHIACLALLPLLVVIGRPSQLGRPLRALLGYFTACAVVFFLKLLADGEFNSRSFQIATRYMYPFVLGIAFLLAYSWAVSKGRGSQFARALVCAVAAASLLQLAVSIPEARGRDINPRHSSVELNLRDDMLDERDVTVGAGEASPLRALGIVRPMTGGFAWINEYGTMISLVVANMLILHRRGIPAWGWPVYALLMLALLGTTTKTSIGTVCLLWAVYVGARFPRYRVMIAGLLAVGMASLSYLSFEHIMYYKGGEDTLMLRMERWANYMALIEREFAPHPMRLLFGAPISFISYYHSGFNLAYGSCENELVYMLVYFGVAGLLAFVGVNLGVMWSLVVRLPSGVRLYALFPILLLGICGTTMDLVHKYFALPLFTLVIMQLDAACLPGVTEATSQGRPTGPLSSHPGLAHGASPA